jgi:hypothetical protein
MVFLLLHPSSSLSSSSALMTGLAKSSQISINLRHYTRSYIAGNDSLHGGRYEDLKSHSGAAGAVLM